MITIAGGWGYYNLGDEAILAGYLEALLGEAEVEVISVDVPKTRYTQMRKFSVRSEMILRRGRGETDALLIAGGGYLNGRWRLEVPQKLGRLLGHGRGRRVATHAVELRHLGGTPTRQLAQKLLSGASVSVRDAASVAVASEDLGVDAAIVPDGISLLYPYIERYCSPGRSRIDGRVLVNLMQIGARSDSSESTFDPAAWEELCRSILTALGSRALGLVVGTGDRAFMEQFPGLELIEPTTVRGLVTALDRSEAVLSTRMHPALLATMLGKPTVAVPYNGKIYPTLEVLGLRDVVLPRADLSLAMNRLESARALQAGSLWQEAHAASLKGLHEVLGAHSA